MRLKVCVCANKMNDITAFSSSSYNFFLDKNCFFGYNRTRIAVRHLSSFAPASLVNIILYMRALVKDG